MFKELVCQLQLESEPFDNLKYRDRTALVLCRDDQGNFILGTKAGYYPAGISRMIGGGISKGESESEGAIREVKEELNILVGQDELIELVKVHVAGERQGQLYQTDVFVYFLNSPQTGFMAGDDVTDLVQLSSQGYLDLVNRLLNLSGTWRDFGQAYGFIHQAALDELVAKGF